MPVIGIDVGGTKTHAIAFDHDDEPIAEVRMPTSSGPAVASTIVDAVTELTDNGGVLPIDKIGIGIPGRVDWRSGTVTQAVNLGIGAEPVPITRHVAEFFDVPCRIDNDVNVAALGAHRLLRRSHGPADLVHLSIGTGIAAGVVLDDRVHRGAHGVAGEIGHLPVVAGGRRCRCGLSGCLETVASGAAIASGWPVAAGESSALSLLIAADSGDARAIEVLEPVAHHLAFAVYTLAVTFDVERIVIGGGVADAGQMLLDAVLASVETLSSQSDFVRSLGLECRIRLAPAGPVGPVGAAALTEESVAS